MCDYSLYPADGLDDDPELREPAIASDANALRDLLREFRDYASERISGADHCDEIWTRVAHATMEKRCRYVSCERCGGSGEVEVRPIVGLYEDPTPCAEICSACDGTGRFCVEPEDMPAPRPQEPEIAF